MKERKPLMGFGIRRGNC